LPAPTQSPPSGTVTDSGSASCGSLTARQPAPSRWYAAQYTSAMRASSTVSTRSAPACLGDRFQRGDADHRQVGAERQALRHRAGDAQAGERAGAGAIADAVELAQPMSDSRSSSSTIGSSSELCRCSASTRRAWMRPSSHSAAEHHSVEVSRARANFIGAILAGRAAGHGAMSR
jgi:hypothetical protein